MAFLERESQIKKIFMKKFLSFVWELIENLILTPALRIINVVLEQVSTFIAAVLPWVILIAIIVWIVG